MVHLSVFKYSTNDRGYVQCVIKDEVIEEFTAMGFVKSVDEVKKPRAKKKAVKDGD